MRANIMAECGIGSRRAMALALAAGLVGISAFTAQGQQAAPTQVVPVAAPSSGDARRDTMVRMMKPIAIEFKDQRLEEVMTFITSLTGADMEVLWMDDRSAAPVGYWIMMTSKRRSMRTHA